MSLRRLSVIILLALLYTCFFTFEALAAEQKKYPGLDGNGLVKLLTDNDGKVLLVNIFASWCPPCVKEVPIFISMRKAFSEEDLFIVGVSVDDEAKELSEFLAKYPINYPIYKAKGNFREAVGVSAIPQLMLFTRGGQLVTNHKGYVDESTLTKAVQDLVNE